VSGSESIYRINRISGTRAGRRSILDVEWWIEDDDGFWMLDVGWNSAFKI
jgi:hypothetical protein